mmetsp:Transcript_31778/g.66841  ORF Transcript_31778/g.66841 Transcript_31778/m.66841 type:complete len:108 (+) Transcript_31778:1147-1470(+)
MSCQNALLEKWLLAQTLDSYGCLLRHVHSCGCGPGWSGDERCVRRRRSDQLHGCGCGSCCGLGAFASSSCCLQHHFHQRTLMANCRSDCETGFGYGSSCGHLAHPIH